MLPNFAEANLPSLAATALKAFDDAGPGGVEIYSRTSCTRSLKCE